MLAGAQDAKAGAWTLPQGKGELIVTGTFTSGERAFDARGRLVPVSEYRKFAALCISRTNGCGREGGARTGATSRLLCPGRASVRSGVR